MDSHASKTGTNANAAAFNQTLSEQRAEAVRTQLISMGIDASQLTTKRYGETQPIANNATPEGRANNQRVEFTKRYIKSIKHFTIKLSGFNRFTGILIVLPVCNI
ncbi:MAG: OmpA family protein [Niabella sp.]